MEARDVIIVGGGHNGLVAAAYCAAAGLKVAVLERRAIVGGAAATEEFHPGFRNSVAAYAVSLLNPTIIRDLDLPRHGLKIVERPLSNLLPLPDGRFLKVGPGRTGTEVAKFSTRDAARLGAYEARIERMADILRAIALEAPPNVTTGRGLSAGLGELLAAARAANRLRPLGIEGQRDLFEIFTRSAGDVLDQWFESDPIKAVLGFDGIVGTYASPYAAGTAYVLLHHCFGETNGRKGAWGHAIGGMGAITQAMARAAAERGVEIRTHAGVAEIAMRNGRAAGVVTETRRTDRGARGRLEPPSETDLRKTRRSRDAAARLSRAHRFVAQRVGRVPNECRALGAAELRVSAGPRLRGASRRRDRDRAESRLHGTRLFRRAPDGLVGGADHRAPHPLGVGRTRSRPRDGTSHRSSASMSRPSFRTDGRGTRCARSSPMS